MMLTPMLKTLKNVMTLMMMTVMMKWPGCPIRCRGAIDSGWRSKGDQSKETHTTFPRNRWILIYSNWKELTTLAAWYRLKIMENKWHKQQQQQQQWEECLPCSHELITSTQANVVSVPFDIWQRINWRKHKCRAYVFTMKKCTTPKFISKWIYNIKHKK